MSLKRLVATILVRQGIAVQSIGFQKYLPLGKPEVAARFFDQWGADEIVLVDIDAWKQEKLIDADLVGRVADEIFVPLTVGGGVRTCEDIRQLLYVGADKVLIQSAIAANPDLVPEAARRFGDQCIIACMNVVGDGAAQLVAGNDRVAYRDVSIQDYAHYLSGLNAGEILVNCIDRDGAGTGFDIQGLKSIVSSVPIPVIAMGGAGQPDHFFDVFAETGVAAAAAGNYFHFAEHQITLVKRFLRDKGMDIRLDTRFDYANQEIGGDGKRQRLSHEMLYDLIFTQVKQEIL